MDTARVPRQDYGTKEPYSARLPFAFSASNYLLSEGKKISDRLASKFIQIDGLKAPPISEEMRKSYVNLRNGSCYHL